MSEAGSRTVITFGTFDVFHVGHLRVIERAAALGDRLVVGVSADALNLSKKGREPVFSQAERLAIVAALKPVDESCTSPAPRPSPRPRSSRRSRPATETGPGLAFGPPVTSTRLG